MEKFLNDVLVNKFSTLVVEMDCESNRLNKGTNFVDAARIGIYNTALYGQLMMNGKYSHGNVIRWSRRLNARDLFDLEKLFIPINVPGQHWF